MTRTDTPRLHSPTFHAARLRRLYSSVSTTGLLAAMGVAMILSISRNVGTLLPAIREGELLQWLADTGLEFGGQGLMALVMVACLGPALSLGNSHGWRRARDLAIALVVASSIAALVRIGVVGYTDGDLPWPRLVQRLFVRFFVRYGYMATLFVVAVEFYRYELSSIEAMHGAEVDRLKLEREMAAARLQVLQAQIEPHFLFNTLANVRRLYQTHAGSGREMLDNLMRYLEVALPRMRDATSSLAREAVLIEAFLNVQKIRMGRRLQFDIDIPPPLLALTVPPMMLLTLVENALKHGINPLPEGGRISIAAQTHDDRLLITVRDTGRGFGEGTSGGGTGLANIRARLAAMFGDGAGLDLSANTPRGVTAELSMPILVADAPEKAAS